MAVCCSKVSKKLLAIKVTMFGWFGASACILPFITVHMKELGLTVEDTTIIYTLLPITQVLFSPVAGFIADKLRRYRNVLLFFLIMTMLLAVAMMYVPAIEKEYHEPSIITILCDDENLVTRSCKKILESNRSENMMYLESCHFKCNKSEQFINITWPVTIYRTNFLRECEYNVTSICALSTTVLPSNCSIMCRELNAIASVPSQATRKGFYLTFVLYAVLRIAYNIVTVTASTLVNSSAIALTETDAEVGDYGKQRFWAMFALAIFSPLAGILIDIISADDGKTNYAPAFHIHNGLICMATVAAWFVDFEMEDKPPGYIETFKNVWKLLKFPSVFAFIIVIFWLGTVWGFLETFLFWFLQELGSPAYLMGLTITVGSLSSLPFLYYAKFFVSKIRYANLVSFGALMYMIRLVGCSYLINPWWIMPFEAMEIFTYHLLWVTAVTYAAHISPPGLLATIQGFLDSLHFGVGQGSGSLIGGSLISVLGYRETFRVMGGISGLIALVYSFLHLVWLRNKNEQPQMRGIAIKRFGKEKNGRRNYTISSNKGISEISSPKSGENIQVLTKTNSEILGENANIRVTQWKLQEKNLSEDHNDTSIHI